MMDRLARAGMIRYFRLPPERRGGLPHLRWRLVGYQPTSHAIPAEPDTLPADPRQGSTPSDET